MTTLHLNVLGGEDEANYHFDLWVRVILHSHHKLLLQPLTNPLSIKFKIIISPTKLVGQLS